MTLNTHCVGPSRAENRPVPITPQLERLLNGAEYYQPLYGISGLEPPLRSCRDRADAIAAALRPLGESFRLIDFGSSLGYFPFYFADRGATATGIDIRPRNVAVALATGLLNGLPARFHCGAFNLELVRGIRRGEYDVALILSVLHHIIHQQGLDAAAELLAELGSRVPVLVLELAHRDEDVPFAWRSSLPDDPLKVLSRCPDFNVRRIGEFPTHLSAATRPIWLAVRKDLEFPEDFSRGL